MKDGHAWTQTLEELPQAAPKTDMSPVRFHQMMWCHSNVLSVAMACCKSAHQRRPSYLYL